MTAYSCESSPRRFAALIRCTAPLWKYLIAVCTLLWPVSAMASPSEILWRPASVTKPGAQRVGPEIPLDAGERGA